MGTRTILFRDDSGKIWNLKKLVLYCISLTNDRDFNKKNCFFFGIRKYKRRNLEEKFKRIHDTTESVSNEFVYDKTVV